MTMESISLETIKGALEHTLLGGDIDEKRMLAHIDEALELGVYGVCVPLAYVPLAKKRLGQSSIKVVTVIDFPLGKKSSEEKKAEAIQALNLGADEIDMVLDYQALINKDYTKTLKDVVTVVDAVKPLPVKVIVETSALNHEQLVCAITIVALSGAAFIKTSTGFHKAGAQLEDIVLMLKLLPKRTEIKASGGIKDYEKASAMLQAGASRIGSSSSRVILENS